MPFYHKLGKLPEKKHTTFYKEDGSLHREELISTKGFSGIYTNMYHLHEPTKTLSVKELDKMPDLNWEDAPLMHFHFDTDKLERSGNFFDSRICYLHNSECKIYASKPTENSQYFYKNAYAHEYIFVHHGKGVLKSQYGHLPFKSGDQIIVPHGTIFKMDFEDFEDVKLMIVESSTPFEYPNHYRNGVGQFEEHAPFEERDFNLPEYAEPVDEKGEFKILIKAGDRLFEYIVPYHPLDVAGWDGYLYPYSLNIRDYNPKVGRIHLPPPVHQFLQTQSFVLCNFNPRYFDWHKKAIPAPYYHSNVDSAEVLYYVEGDFMSRKGVKDGSVTLHPMGIPHGPQPGKTEASVGKKWTEEYAVMVDTFAPLYPTIEVKKCLDEAYHYSWLEDKDK